MRGQGQAGRWMRWVRGTAVAAALAMSATPLAAARAEGDPPAAPGSQPASGQPALSQPAMSAGALVDRSALIRSLLPTVVNITARIVTEEAPSAETTPRTRNATVKAERPGVGYETKVASGSGFIIDPDGTIVTNWHVVAGAYEIFVVFSDGARVPATVQAHTKLVDIALLKVQTPRKLTAITWGRSEAVQVGDPVLAIGNPLGIGQTVTSGIVSAMNRNISASPYDEFIQTDAAINHGNSGGPLFNLKGEVIGVDTAIVSPTSGSVGLGFAIPANHAQFAISRLRKYGAIRPGWLGMIVQEVTPNMAVALDMAEPHGAIVAGVSDGGPASRAGLQVGDLILKVDEDAPSDERALLRNIATRLAGDSVRLTVLRGGREVTLAATIGDWPQSLLESLDPPAQVRYPRQDIPPDLGMKLSALTAANRAQYQLPPEVSGALVAAVMPGSAAVERSIAQGDVIMRVGDVAVTAPAVAQAQFDAARAAKKRFVMALIYSRAAKRVGPHWYALRVLGDEWPRTAAN